VGGVEQDACSGSDFECANTGSLVCVCFEIISSPTRCGLCGRMNGKGFSSEDVTRRGAGAHVVSGSGCTAMLPLPAQLVLLHRCASLHHAPPAGRVPALQAYLWRLTRRGTAAAVMQEWRD
jgi:hypothetical protein